MSDHPTNMQELVDEITHEWVQLNSTLDQFDARTANEVSDANGWTVRDHAAHLISWERSILYLLLQRPQHEGLGISHELSDAGDIDTVNEAVRRASTDQSWESVRAELEDNHAAFMSHLSGLSWDDIHRPYSHYDPDATGENTGEPVAYWVYGNTVGHFSEHRQWIEEMPTSV